MLPKRNTTYRHNFMESLRLEVLDVSPALKYERSTNCTCTDLPCASCTRLNPIIAKAEDDNP